MKIPEGEKTLDGKAVGMDVSSLLLHVEGSAMADVISPVSRPPVLALVLHSRQITVFATDDRDARFSSFHHPSVLPPPRWEGERRSTAA